MCSTISLLVAAVATQSTVTLINSFGRTLTLKSSESGRTTYTKSCSATSNSPPASIRELTLIRGSPPNFPVPTVKARLHRQEDYYAPYAITQGDSTWELHLTEAFGFTWDYNRA
ncbi:hypothetical protein CC78DRAFT_545759 [Lojkania enalia]|uniref:Uncharacterized protein n=1 Tax=Lojkania enalia TaxID=147567 RepID=A0A9P4N7P2_9PLEO|nr:hypothetical protein CC78DRAFT_545759 [Didymosphaeria enalia]